VGHHAGSLERRHRKKHVRRYGPRLDMNTLAAATSEAMDIDSAWPRSILLVGPLPPPSGGMANQTRQLARLLADEGCNVVIAQVNAPYRPSWIAPLRGVRALFRLLPYLLTLWRNTGRVDLVHVMANSGWAWHLFAAPAVWIGKLRRKAVVVNYRGGDAAAFLERQARWVVPTLERASTVIVPSGFLKNTFAGHGVVAQVVPNVVDLQRFAPGASGGAAPHLIVTRNLEDIYDIPTALRAFVGICDAFPGATLTVAGSGPRRDALVQLATELGIAGEVTFTGRLDNENIAELYRRADVVLNPSRVDNMPNSLLEAMASGVPIVSTDVGGIPYFVRHEETALLVPPNDPVAMTAAALQILTDQALARRLRIRGLDAVKAYMWPRVRVQLAAVYSAVVAALPRADAL
jgi:glycosyltransferase involved in cell wall biosynthesis